MIVLGWARDFTRPLRYQICLARLAPYSRFSLMRVLKAVVPLEVGVAIVGPALVVSGALETKTAVVTGTIYTCNGVFGTTCRAEATAGLIIELTELGLVRHTFSAVSHRSEEHTSELQSRRYTVQLPR